MSEKLNKKIENAPMWTEEDEATLSNLLDLIEKTKANIAEIDRQIEELEMLENGSKEKKENTLIVREEIQEIENEIEKENEEKIETKLVEQLPQIKEKVVREKTKEKINKIPKILRSKLLKYIIIPLGLATGIATSLNNPKEYYEMAKNWKERHLDKKDENDPTIIGIDAIYNDTTDIQKTTYDFIGKEKINYKFGYYMTSVFDLTDRTPPRFKYINERENFSKMDSSAGITTTLFEEFKTPTNFKPNLKEHLDHTPEEIQEIPVIGYNPKTQMVKAGHLKEFKEDWLVSETYEIPLNFKLNGDKTVNLIYPHSTMRMVALTTNENGKQIPFPIGITKDKSKKTFNPYEATRFGVLEGGKVIMVCGEKQLQVNGSFADMFRVYERLKKENPNKKISAYLLDNGSYNLPIWDKDSTLTPNEIKEHVLRHRGGGTALVLINDNKISPFEYKNKYKEHEHYTPNFTKDSITGKPAINEKSVIVLHHTGHYHHSNAIIKQFKEDTTMGNAHVLILKDGTRHLFNTDDYVLAHAGKSVFNNRDKVNYFSLGIELEGDSRDKNAFSIAQIESMLEYMRPRIEKYNIKFDNIIDHKRIRDNWLKANPSGLDEKGKKVYEKEDLDDKVWQQFQKIIQEKIYKKTQNKDLGMNEKKLIGLLSFQEFFRVSKNTEFSLNESKKILKKNGFTVKEIKTVFHSIKEELPA